MAYSIWRNASEPAAKPRLQQGVGVGRETARFILYSDEDGRAGCGRQATQVGPEVGVAPCLMGVPRLPMDRVEAGIDDEDVDATRRARRVLGEAGNSARPEIEGSLARGV